METLKRQFEGDKYVDFRSWATKPSKSLRTIVGDLSSPENVTIQKAAEIFGEAIHYLNLHKYSLDPHPVDSEYAINAFGFVVDNLVSSGVLKPEAKEFVIALNQQLLDLIS